MIKPSLKRISIAIVVAAASALAILGLYSENILNKNAFIIDDSSMSPTINQGDRIKIRKVPANEVKRSDIIVFNKLGGKNKSQVKRVVGLPSDTVTVSDGSLVVTKVDGTEYMPFNDKKTPGNSKIKVAPNSFYVAGDNRPNSLDSTVDSYGLVPFDSLLGVVTN